MDIKLYVAIQIDKSDLVGVKNVKKKTCPKSCKEWFSAESYCPHCGGQIQEKDVPVVNECFKEWASSQNSTPELMWEKIKSGKLEKEERIRVIEFEKDIYLASPVKNPGMSKNFNGGRTNTREINRSMDILSNHLNEWGLEGIEEGEADILLLQEEK